MKNQKQISEEDFFAYGAFFDTLYKLNVKCKVIFNQYRQTTPINILGNLKSVEYFSPEVEYFIGSEE